MKKAIAMRCTQEQFEAIKPKLEFVINNTLDLNNEPYLCNYINFNKNEIGSNIKYRNLNETYEMHETWNEKTFLEACGIETKETFEITEEQIKQLHENGSEQTYFQLKEWFPKVFEEKEIKLEVGKWHTWQDQEVYILWFITKIENKTIYGYGFYNDTWTENGICYSKRHYDEASKELKPATKQEVFEALKNEAVKRGFVDGAHYQWVNCPIRKVSGNDFVLMDDVFRINGFSIMDNSGQWAEIISTITKEQAEKELGKKII